MKLKFGMVDGGTGAFYREGNIRIALGCRKFLKLLRFLCLHPGDLAL